MVLEMTGRCVWLVVLTATGGVRWASSPLSSYIQMSPLSSAKHHRPLSGGGRMHHSCSGGGGGGSRAFHRGGGGGGVVSTGHIVV